MTPLAPLVTAFFRKHLAAEKGVSKNTIASYSYPFKFRCRYVSGRGGKAPSALCLEDLDAPVIRDFLEYLERECGNTPRTRNLRLTALRSFMQYVEYEMPAALDQVRQIRALSNKRTLERLVNHLTREEMKAVLDAPNPGTRCGVRDQAMLYLGFAAGLRVSELVGLHLDDVELDGPYPSLLVRGKARKQRRLPLWQEATRALRAWLAVRGSVPTPEVFLNAHGEALTTAGFTYIVKSCVRTATLHCPSLAKKRVSPHVMRHYVPFPTMSSDADERLQFSFASYWLRRRCAWSITRHSLLYPTGYSESRGAGLRELITPWPTVRRRCLRRGPLRHPQYCFRRDLPDYVYRASRIGRENQAVAALRDIVGKGT